MVSGPPSGIPAFLRVTAMIGTWANYPRAESCIRITPAMLFPVHVTR